MYYNLFCLNEHVSCTKGDFVHQRTNNTLWSV